MRRTSAFTYIAERSLGLHNDFQDEIYCEEACNLQAARRNYIYDGGMRVWCMALDPVDEQYLLVGSSKSVINLYDLKSLDDNDAADPNGTNPAVRHYDTDNRLLVNSSVVAQRIRREQLPTTRATASSSSSLSIQQRHNQPGIEFGISCIDWYPVDGGLFVTSSFDGLVRVWDANVFSVEAEFAFPCKVFAAKFSPISTTHSLIAAATANREVRLCDMASDTSIHSLIGHQEEIWSLAWSQVNEFQLSTGSRNGEIRMWDIRRSGATACLLCLNQDGAADVPGRSSLYTNVKKLPSISLVTASQPQCKRRRLSAPNSGKETARNDPNMAATVSLARAHGAGVNSLAYTPDGRFLLSSGHDHNLRVWDATTGEHLFVNYQSISSSQIARNVEMAVVQEGRDAQSGTLVFHPNGKHGELTSYKVHPHSHSGETNASGSGVPLTRATAHYKPIVSCVYRKTRRELFTGSSDGLIMKWTPMPVSFDTVEDEEEEKDEDAPRMMNRYDHDQDAWSDDDDDGEGAAASHPSSGVFVPPILRQEY